MRSPVADLLDDFGRALDGTGVRWYLFGAQAAILYGSARLTADVDATVRLPQGVTATALVSRLDGHGFRSRIDDPSFVAATRVLPFVHIPTGLPVDVVLAGPGLEEQFLERTRLLDVEGVRIPVASPEDLVVMKVLAGRVRDDEDIRAIADANADTLDLPYVRTTIRALEEALGQSDLLAGLDRALTATRRGR